MGIFLYLPRLFKVIEVRTMENGGGKGPVKVINSLETLDNHLFVQDKTQNVFYLSEIPQLCKDLPCILGIDEAGRGPVLGPMVYGTAFCPVEEDALLKTLGCADSKQLSEVKREEIFEKICESSKTIGWAVEVISPNKICNSMFSRIKHSLNAVSMDSAIGLIRAAIDAGVNIAHIYVDTVGQPEKYQARLLTIFPDYKITVAKKADSTYPIVSAASICAKVVRDHALKTWTFSEGLDLTHKDFGSGYPGDAVTKKFLNENCNPVFGFPQLVRFSWSTAGNLLDENAYHVEWDEVDDEAGHSVPTTTTSITSFFKMDKPKLTKKARHEFFKQRYLSNVVEF